MFLIEFLADGKFQVLDSDMPKYKTFHRCFAFGDELWSFDWAEFSECALDEANCRLQFGGYCSEAPCTNQALVEQLHQLIETWEWSEAVVTPRTDVPKQSDKLVLGVKPCCATAQARDLVVSATEYPASLFLERLFRHRGQWWSLSFSSSYAGVSVNWKLRRLEVSPTSDRPSPLRDCDSAELQALVDSANNGLHVNLDYVVLAVGLLLWLLVYWFSFR